jgi:hypothetical protein
MPQEQEQEQEQLVIVTMSDSIPGVGRRTVLVDEQRTAMWCLQTCRQRKRTDRDAAVVRELERWLASPVGEHVVVMRGIVMTVRESYDGT